MWFEPKIDWASNETMYADDWNAIIYDADYILTAIGNGWQGTELKNHYLVPEGGVFFLPLYGWQTVRQYLESARITIGVPVVELPTDDLNAEQLNRMEMLLLLEWEKLEQNKSRLYVNDGIYTGDYEIYVR